MQLSPSARSLWAKKSRSGEMLWLPLIIHMADSAAIARMLWVNHLPAGLRQRLDEGVGEGDLALGLFLFLAAAHDIGKATPVFQAKNCGYVETSLDQAIRDLQRIAGVTVRPYRDFSAPEKTPHALCTELLLEQENLSPQIAGILGAHHGKPANYQTLNDNGIAAYSANFFGGSAEKPTWTRIQKELLGFALELSGYESIEGLPRPDQPAQVLLSGLLVMTDWIASNEDLFPYFRPEDPFDPMSSEPRAELAWAQLSLPPSWVLGCAQAPDVLYQRRFGRGFIPKTMQLEALSIAMHIGQPGIFVLEAPMGLGKTEAALTIAEVFAQKSRRSGVFFALPTQATSNAMFTRMLRWIQCIDGLHSVRLAHGKAQFNEEYRNLFGHTSNICVDDDELGAVAHQWFEGQKKSMLADFVVGTIDQLLLAALKQKHVMLRHIGLASKVVIIDECHAYDAYMNAYLERALAWMGAYKVPVIVLSATLPQERRRSVIDAYLGQTSASQPLADWHENRGYPLMTYTDGSQILQHVAAPQPETCQVEIDGIALDAVADRLSDLLTDGGCAGVIFNTVARAQQMAAALRVRFGNDVVLLHSLFLAPDRMEREAKLIAELGKPGAATHRPKRRIVVGTQIFEQSMDLDFDVLITDLCPMDLLLQRIGRLHRHARPRPKVLAAACCLVIGRDEADFEPGAEHIYGRYLLQRTRSYLPECLILPTDIPELIHKVYAFEAQTEDNQDERESLEQWREKITGKQQRASAFRLRKPQLSPRACLIDWLNTEAGSSERGAEATVRDGEESIEVLLLQQKGAGQIGFLPWREGGAVIPQSEALPDELARYIAQQQVRLPSALCLPNRIEATIAALEKVSFGSLRAWQQSKWLKGELFLILDERAEASLNGFRLSYSREDGLSYEREDERHV